MDTQKNMPKTRLNTTSHILNNRLNNTSHIYKKKICAQQQPRCGQIQVETEVKRVYSSWVYFSSERISSDESQRKYGTKEK